MVLQWRQPPAPLELSWRGPSGDMLAAVERDGVGSITALIGPPGPAGPASSETQWNSTNW